MDDIERVAAVMGMKAHREVQEAVPVDDGTAARTHDGRWTLVRDDGTTAPCEAPELVVERDHGTAELASGGIVSGPPHIVGERGPEPVVVPPASKRRGRS